MLDPTADDSSRDEFATTTRSRIEGGGSLIANDNWGVRKMAYEIDKHGESDYRYYRFRSEPALLDELNHNLKIADSVLRFRIFKVDPRTPTTAPPELSTLEREREERGDRGERGDRRGGAPVSPPAETEAEAAVESAPSGDDTAAGADTAADGPDES